VPIRTVYDVAEAEYQPRHVVRDEIVLYRATGGTGDDEAYKELYADPMLGWQKRTLAGVRVIDVAGGHGSMLEEPHVAALAEPLSAYLDAAPPAASLTAKLQVV
jgi:thioesterase domain-containing protein